MEKIRPEEAQGLILALLFVFIAIVIGGIALWGFLNLNIPVAVLGSIGEVAWFFGGKHII